MVTTTLFTLFAAQAHANSTLTAHRKLQEGCGDVFTRVSEVNAACCPSGGGHRRMQQCSPTTCSSSCATIFVPFLDDCGGILVAGGQDLTHHFGLYYSCRQAAPSAGCGAGGNHPPPLFSPEPEPEPEPHQPQKIYALGGNCWLGSCTIFNTAEAYDPTTNTWTAIASMGTGRMNLAATTLNGKIYAVGGDSGSSSLNTAEAYDPTTNTWTAIMPMGTRRMQLAATTLNGKIYALGGYDGQAMNSAEAYDPTFDVWTAIASMGAWRADLAAATLGGKIYALGGLSSSQSSLNTAEAYDPTTNTWTAIASMGIGRMNLAAATLNGKIYAVGGEYRHTGHEFDDDFFVTINSAEAYDPTTNTWTAIAPMGTRRMNLAATTLNGKIYAVGGDDGVYVQPNIPHILNTTEAYDPPTNTWTAIASMGTTRDDLAAATL
jgi:N-acetylneuraminic acid mutarotase